MKNIKIVLIGLFLFGCFEVMKAQSIGKDKKVEERNWFVNIDFGMQMSGIKKEDFIMSNYSPLYRVSIGKWISPTIGLKMGYQGIYFNAISDEVKHFYDFYFGEVVFDIVKILNNNSGNRKHDFLFHLGSGYFYNHSFNHPTICGVFGVNYNFKLSNFFKLKIDSSAIVGWDIYQGDDDILPGISTGIVYSF